MTEQKDRMKAMEMHFLRAVSGYQLTEHRSNKDKIEELQIRDIFKK
jgi:hypothetical protein